MLSARERNQKGTAAWSGFLHAAVPLLLSLLFSFDADTEPFRKLVLDDDPGIGRRTGDDDDVNGDDVNGSQVNMQVGRKARAEAEKNRMDQIDGVGIVS